MIGGIGIDAVELDRIEVIISEKQSFIKRVLTNKELEIFNKLSKRRQIEFLGGRFACKEAFSKAYGTGIGKVGFQDIEIINDEYGKPIAIVNQHIFSGQVHVSITHTKDLAMAQIILEK